MVRCNAPHQVIVFATKAAGAYLTRINTPGITPDVSLTGDMRLRARVRFKADYR